jgi:hypothetical protein
MAFTYERVAIQTGTTWSRAVVEMDETNQIGGSLLDIVQRRMATGEHVAGIHANPDTRITKG